MTQKVIVTTTINKPTQALLKFINFKDWDVVIVGDLKTPHNLYDELQNNNSNVKYLSPTFQEDNYKELSDSIGWCVVARRNIGLKYAYDNKYIIIATVDDDNYPYDNWGQNILVGKEIEVDIYDTNNLVFEPLSVTNYKHLWHRGYPIELVNDRHNNIYLGKKKIKILIQADLWDGHPDIDAMSRLQYNNPIVKFDIKEPYTSTKIVPFNSQNTFIHRSVLPYYCVLAYTDRMDDIWGGYLCQHILKDKLPFVVFNKASVYQDRSCHVWEPVKTDNLIDTYNIVKCSHLTDLKREIMGYDWTFKFLNNLKDYEEILNSVDKKITLFLKEYFKLKDNF